MLKAHFTLPRNQGFLCLKYHKFSSTIINTIYICQFRCGRTTSTKKSDMRNIPSSLALSVCKIRSRTCHSYNVTIQRKSKSVYKVKKHSGSDFCSLLPGNSNALPRIWHPKFTEHFPTTRIAIIGKIYFAISRDCSEQ